MSADNWALCPRCIARAKKAEAAQLAEVMADYGKIPVAEFDARRAAIEPVEIQDYQTFREEYDIYNPGGGTVAVSYSGGCNVCGLGLKFENEHQIPGADEA